MNIFSKKFLERSLFIFAIAFVLFFGTFHLTESPPIWYDEGFYTQLALNVSNFGIYGIQVAPNNFISASEVTGGFPLVYPVALSYSIFSEGVLSGRIVMVLFLLLCVVSAWMYVRKVSGTFYAIGAILLLATLPLLYGNGKSVLGEVPGLLFFFLLLISLLFLERSQWRSTKLVFASALLFGLCMATKPIFILLLPALGLAFLVFSLYKKISLKHYFIALLGFGIPLCVWFFTQFGVHDSLTSVLSFYANPYDSQNTGELIIKNLVALVTESTPLYTFGMTLLWGISLLLRRVSKEGPISFAEIVAFFFSCIVLVAFLRLPGWYRYLFPAMAVSLTAFPFSITHLVRFLSRFVSVDKKVVYIVSTSCIAVLLSVHSYQLLFTSFVAEYYGGTRTAIMSATLENLSEDESIFLFNVPELAVLLPSPNYYQYIEPHPEGIIGVEQLDLIEKGMVNIVIATHAMYESRPETFHQYKEVSRVSRYVLLQQELTAIDTNK